MARNQDISRGLRRLRHLAEKAVADSRPPGADSSPHPDEVLHELRVHQIELEMQNEELRKSINELENSRTRYTELYDFAPVAYFTLDAYSRILEVNLTGAGLLMMDRKDLRGSLFTRYIDQEFQDKFYLHRRDVFGTDEKRKCELALKRKDGERLIVLMESRAVPGHEGLSSQMLSAVIDIDERKRIEIKLEAEISERQKTEDELKASLEKVQRLAVELERAENRERRRIAEELHDRLGQTLAIIKMKLGMLSAPGAAGERRKTLKEIKKLVEDSIAEARSLTVQLSPPVLSEIGLVHALSWLSEEISAESGIPIGFEAAPVSSFGREIDGIIFRSVRELLRNLIRHSRATRGRVALIKSGGFVEIRVEDNGIGISETDLAKKNSYGLFSIKERLGHIGGRLIVHSGQDSPTVFTIRIPSNRTSSSG